MQEITLAPREELKILAGGNVYEIVHWDPSYAGGEGHLGIRLAGYAPMDIEAEISTGLTDNIEIAASIVLGPSPEEKVF